MKTFALIVALAVPATPALAGHCHSGKCVHRPVLKRVLRCVRRRHRQCCVRAVRRKECCTPNCCVDCCCTECCCVQSLLSTPEGRESLHKLIHQSEPCEGED